MILVRVSEEPRCYSPAETLNPEAGTSVERNHLPQLPAGKLGHPLLLHQMRLQASQRQRARRGSSGRGRRAADVLRAELAQARSELREAGQLLQRLGDRISRLEGSEGPPPQAPQPSPSVPPQHPTQQPQPQPQPPHLRRQHPRPCGCRITGAEGAEGGSFEDYLHRVVPQVRRGLPSSSHRGWWCGIRLLPVSRCRH